MIKQMFPFFTDLPVALPACSPLPHLSDQLAGIRVSMLDITQIHPLASGNKFFKLVYNIDLAIQQGYTQVLSFGGAYSNHIHALAGYASARGLQSIGIIRGEPEYAANPTLTAARKWGMQLHFVDRTTYRQRHDTSYLHELAAAYPDTLIIPEGGSNQLAVKGMIELARLIHDSLQHPPDAIAVACGSGGTLAGLVAGLQPQQRVLGYTVVRDHGIADRVNHLLTGVQTHNHNNYELIAADYGGYAHFDELHLEFILQWLEQTGILLDPVYTSKLCRRFTEMLVNRAFASPQHICLLHTGGLQGWHGMREKVIRYGGEEAWRIIAAKL